MTFQFTKATKKRAKARIALDGPSGSGKTFTALMAATVLAEGGKVAVIDTEHGSASLYSDRFAFDVLELATFSPAVYVQAIEAAEKAGYAVIVIDSLSHAWEGEGGALEMVDAAAARSQSKNSYFAWRDVTPLHRKMVEAIIGSPCHIVATMRSKTEYIIDTDSRGKQVPRKIGMAPVQRQGMEYEFTIFGDMDLDHRLIISKSRCEALADKSEPKPGPAFWEILRDWLNSGETPAEQPKVEAKPATPVLDTARELGGVVTKVNGKPTAEATATHKPAVIRAQDWKDVADELAARVPYYANAKGGANYFYIAGAAGKTGYTEITDNNIVDVVKSLEAYAAAQAEPAAA